jgi:hypothetical protein
MSETEYLVMDAALDAAVALMKHYEGEIALSDGARAAAGTKLLAAINLVDDYDGRGSRVWRAKCISVPQ